MLAFCFSFAFLAFPFWFCCELWQHFGMVSHDEHRFKVQTVSSVPQNLCHDRSPTARSRHATAAPPFCPRWPIWAFSVGRPLNEQRALLSHTTWYAMWQKHCPLSRFCAGTSSGIAHKISLHIFALVAEPAKIRPQPSLPCQARRRAELVVAAALVLLHLPLQPNRLHMSRTPLCPGSTTRSAATRSGGNGFNRMPADLKSRTGPRRLQWMS